MKKTDVEAKMIGRRIIITNAKNKSLIGISGKVIDETRNMLLVRAGEAIKKLIKKQIEFEER